jgi:hypothetical protein
MLSRVRLLYRVIGAAVVGVSLFAFGPAGVFAAFEVHGTIISTNDAKETWVIVTDGLGKPNQPITVDLSSLSGTFRNHDVGETVALLIQPRANDTYKVLSLISEGSYVNGDDLGVQERYETQDSSIKAHVGNVPEDDESLNEQHRDNDLRRNDEEAKGNQNGSQ